MQLIIVTEFPHWEAMDCKLCGKDLKEERRWHFVCSVSTSTKIAIDSALWHEGRGYLEFFNSQTDRYVCTREKLTRGETTKTMLCLSSFLILDSSSNAQGKMA